MKNADQIEYWNGEAGAKWRTNADRLDALLHPFLDAILATAALEPGEPVLDIGCGAGALTLAAAETSGLALGVDVSEPLVARARERAIERNSAARFEIADASSYKPTPTPAAIVSRFGVMFFDDPVAAFDHIRRQAPGARLVFACWQALTENDWAFAPLQVALPFLPQPPSPPPPGTPGPFAFSDKDRVAGLLGEAGWTSIEISSWNGDLNLPGDTPEDTSRFMLDLGPVSRLVREAGIDLVPVAAALQRALSDRARSDGRVSLPGAAWIVSAAA